MYINYDAVLAFARNIFNAPKTHDEILYVYGCELNSASQIIISNLFIPLGVSLVYVYSSHLFNEVLNTFAEIVSFGTKTALNTYNRIVHTTDLKGKLTSISSGIFRHT